MRIMVLGGDGFLGWPAALQLSDAGHDVTIVDALARRGADVELQAGSLTPIRSLNTRIAAWHEETGKRLDVSRIDVAQDHEDLRDMLAATVPDAVVHGAQQRAAHYSMTSAAHRRYTVDNNVSATHNLLAALAETGVDAHVVHLTTARPDPDSVAGLTKTLDEALLAFAAHRDGVRVTALHLGVVWGIETAQTARDGRLVNRFDYDGDYGTTLNRLLAQAAVGHPLLVPGAGDAPCALVHIEDAVRCVQLAIEQPAPAGRVRRLEQATEAHRVRDLAIRVAQLTGATLEPGGAPVPPAPDVPAGMLEDPLPLEDGLLQAVVDLAARHRDRCDTARIPWRGVAEPVAQPA